MLSVFFFSIRLYVSCQDKIAFAPDFNGSIVPALANAPKSSSLVNSCVAHGFSVGSANVIKETYFFGGIAYLSIFHCQKLYTIASTRMQCNTVRGSVNTVDGTRFILPFSFHFVVPCSVCVCVLLFLFQHFFFFFCTNKHFFRTIFSPFWSSFHLTRLVFVLLLFVCCHLLSCFRSELWCQQYG